MRGKYETYHVFDETQTCEHCEQRVVVALNTRYEVRNGVASATIQLASDEGGLLASIAGLLGALPRDVTIRDVVPVDSRRLLVNASHGGHAIAPITVEYTILTVNEPHECSYEADICSHERLIGTYCYYCPDHRAADRDAAEA